MADIFDQVDTDIFDQVSQKKSWGQKLKDWTSPREPEPGENANLYALSQTIKDVNLELPRALTGLVTGGLEAARTGTEGYKMVGAGLGNMVGDQTSNEPWYDRFTKGAMEERARINEAKQKGVEKPQSFFQNPEGYDINRINPIGGESQIFKHITEGVEGTKNILLKRADEADMSTLDGQVRAAVDHGLVAGIDFIMQAGMLVGLTKMGKSFVKSLPAAAKTTVEAGKTAYEAAKKAPQATKDAYQATKDAFTDPHSAITKLNQSIYRGVESVFKPEKTAKFPGQRENNIRQASDVADDIYRATKQEGFEFSDANGNPISNRAPKNAYEMLQVAEIQMGKIWDRISNAMEQAGLENEFSLMPLVEQLRQKAAAWDGRAATQAWADAARKYADQLEAQGTQKLGNVLEDLKAWGEKRPGTWNANDAVTAEVIDPIISYLKENADAFVDKAPGFDNTFLQDRKLYAGYRSYIKNITRDASKYQKDAVKSGINQFDIIAAVGGLASFLKHSPKGAILAAGMEGLNLYRKKMRSPDRHVKNLFKDIERREHQRSRIPKPGEPMDFSDAEWRTAEERGANYDPNMKGPGEGVEILGKDTMEGNPNYDPNLVDITPPKEAPKPTDIQTEAANIQNTDGAVPPSTIPAKGVTPPPGELAGRGAFFNTGNMSRVDINALVKNLQEQGFDSKYIAQMVDLARRMGPTAGVAALYFLADDDKKNQILGAVPFLSTMMFGKKGQLTPEQIRLLEKDRFALRKAGVDADVKTSSHDITIFLKDKDGNPIMRDLVSYGPNGERIVTKPRGGNIPAGIQAHFDYETGRFIVKLNEIPQDLAGKGIGISLLRQATDAAHKMGKDITSDDNATSKEAAKLYPAMERRGYRVNQHPNMVTEPDTGAVGVPWDRKGFHSAFTLPLNPESAKVYQALVAVGATALAAKFLNSDEETRKKMMAMPMVMGIMAGKKARGFGEAPGKFTDLLDRKVRFPISDANAKVPPPNIANNIYRETISKGKTPILGQFFDHPELYRNYPQAKNISVKINPNLPEAALFDKSTNTIEIREFTPELKKDIIHEVTHKIQEIEGFSKGTNPMTMANLFADEIQQMRERGATEAEIAEFADKKYRETLGEEEARRAESQSEIPQEDLVGNPYQLSDIENPQDLIHYTGSSIPAKVEPFYSKALEVAKKDDVPRKTQSIIPFLRKHGVTEAEIKELRLFEFLKGKERVEPQELQKYIDDNSVKLKEDFYGTPRFEEDAQSEKLLESLRELSKQKREELSEINSKLVALERVYMEAGIRTFTDQPDYKALFNKARSLTKDLDTISENYKQVYNAKQKALDELDDSYKSPKYESYKAIKSQDGVIPDSYSEEFVTAELPQKPIEDIPWKEVPIEDGRPKFVKEFGKLRTTEIIEEKSPSGMTVYTLKWFDPRYPFDKRTYRTGIPSLEEAKTIADDLFKKDARPKGWKDEHHLYDSTENPLVRIRYDIKKLDDGRKVMRIQELQDPKAVRKSRMSPEEFAKKEYLKNRVDSNISWEELSESGREGWIEEARSQSKVPSELATRALELGVKKAISKAKELGLDGIEWTTGDQTRDLYNSALRRVADEARWNPETKELTIYKAGHKVQSYENTPKEKLADYLGRETSERLLASKLGEEVKEERVFTAKYGDSSRIGATISEAKEKAEDMLNWLRKQFPNNNYELMQGDDFSSFEIWEKKRKPIEEHQVKDIVIDAGWPGKIYGDFEKVTKERPRIGEKEEYSIDEDTESVKYPVYLDNKRIAEIHYDPFENDYYIRDLEDASNSGGGFKTLSEAKQAATDQFTRTTGDGSFNTKALLPSLLKKHAKGEFEINRLNPNALGEFDWDAYNELSGGEIANALSRELPEEFEKIDSTRLVGNLRMKQMVKELVESNGDLGEISVRNGNILSRSNVDVTKIIDWAKKKWAKQATAKNAGQPVMWFTKDTPSSFPIYEGVTGIFSMLQDQIKKEGGGAKGIAKTALKYGIPAAALAAWLKADDETKKKWLTLPMFAAIGGIKAERLKAEGTAAHWINRNETGFDFNKINAAKEPIAELKKVALTKMAEKLMPESYQVKSMMPYLERWMGNDAVPANPELARAIQSARNNPEAANRSLMEHVNKARKEGVTDWNHYLRVGNDVYAQDPFFQEFVIDGITKGLEDGSPNVPPPLDPAALSMVYDEVSKNPSNASFDKLYTKFGIELAQKRALSEGNAFNMKSGGQWIKVPRTSQNSPEWEKNYQQVRQISHANWCTSGTMAQHYLPQGDFWVFQEDGQAKLAIRFKGDEIAEIQGPRNNGTIPPSHADKVEELVNTKAIKLNDKQIEKLAFALEQSDGGKLNYEGVPFEYEVLASIKGPDELLDFMKRKIKYVNDQAKEIFDRKVKGRSYREYALEQGLNWVNEIGSVNFFDKDNATLKVNYYRKSNTSNITLPQDSAFKLRHLLKDPDVVDIYEDLQNVRSKKLDIYDNIQELKRLNEKVKALEGKKINPLNKTTLENLRKVANVRNRNIDPYLHSLGLEKKTVIKNRRYADPIEVDFYHIGDGLWVNVDGYRDNVWISITPKLPKDGIIKGTQNINFINVDKVLDYIDNGYELPTNSHGTTNMKGPSGKDTFVGKPEPTLKDAVKMFEGSRAIVNRIKKLKQNN